MKYGLIGEHLKHSFSKQIHESLSGNTYELKEIAKNELDFFMKQKDFLAINVTIPYKEKVIPYLDEISEEAREVGAVNCVVNRDNKLFGYNSDVLGFISLLEFKHINVKGKVVLVLGNGGASKAVKYALNKLGAKQLLVASINDEPNTIKYEEIYLHQEVEIIVNTTPVGMFPNNENQLIDINKFPLLQGYVDVIYNPIRTKTVLDVEARGVPAIGGLYMLIAQGVKASEIFLNREYDPEVTLNLYKDVLRNNSNIVLIGMPSSGKSTIGKRLSQLLNIPYIDTDEEIIKDIKMPIKDYFAQHGETSFRDKETEIVKRLYKSTPNIISTGGGIILKEENIRYLKQNGKLIFISRDLNNLVATSDRPLSSNNKDLETLYNYRLPLYKKYADITIDNNDKLEDAVKQIMEEVL